MSTEDREAGDFFLWALGFFMAVMIAYVVTYFALARPAARIWFAPSGRFIYSSPTYRGLPKGLFEPIHYVDRAFLRPKLWGKVQVWTIVRDGAGVTNSAARIAPYSLEGVRPGTSVPDSAPAH